MNREESKGASCPRCGWSNVRASARTGFWDYALAFLFLEPMRCRKCRHRFHRPWFIAEAAASIDAPEVETRNRLPVVTSPQAHPATAILLADASAVLLVDDAAPLPHPIAVAAEITPPIVLLVDEDEAMRKLLAMLLSREGYTVRHAADPGEATTALNANTVDLVIANLNEDGQPVVIREWRSADPQLSIIAFSSGVETGVFSDAIPVSNLLILPRPCRPSTVVRGVRAMLEASRVEA